MTVIHTPSPNFNARPSAIDSIILHYTDMISAEAALAWLINPSCQVSAHYLIDEKGQIFQMVDEEQRAWHAGESYWQGRSNLNDCSIGIELANPGHSHGYMPFPEAQISSLINLCLDIKKRWSIPGSRILGHSDIAPQRKQDPGHLFPWERLAKEGLGMWPVPLRASSPRARSANRGPRKKLAIWTNISWVPDIKKSYRSLRSQAFLNSGMTPAGEWGEVARKAGEGYLSTTELNLDVIAEMLSQLGYDITSPHHALLAFQRHFQPHKVDGVADQETYMLLQSLLKSQEMLI